MAEAPRRGQWSRRPDPKDLNDRVPLLRVGPKGLSGAIILSHDLIGCLVHYHRGRSTPCTGKTCTACEDRAEVRWRGWLSVWNPKSQKEAILEVTPGTTKAIDEWFSAHRTLRGSMVAIQRVPAKPNGRLVIDVRSSGLPLANLPTACDVQSEMERMWCRNLERLHRHAKETSLKIATDGEHDAPAASA